MKHVKHFVSLALLSLIFMPGIFAQRGNTGNNLSGSIQFLPQNYTHYIVEIVEPVSIQENMSGGLIIQNLFSGDYWVKIAIPSKRYGPPTYFFNQAVRVQPGKRTVIKIAANNRVDVSYVVDGNSLPLCMEVVPVVPNHPPQVHDYHDHNRPNHGREPQIHPISDRELDNLLNEINRTSFDNDKIKLLRTAAGYQFYTSNQLGRVMKLFSFDDKKLECARIMVPRVVDPENLYLQASVFSFSAQKNQYLELIRGR